MQYRPDVDGLRALAVLAVVCFHLDDALAPGGFVGVDVFFVISGYLITGIIDAECKRGRFSLLGFYRRRICRIFPALFVMLAVSWCAAALVLLPSDFRAWSESLIAASLSVSNVLFWSQAGYFDGPSELKPLLHTWSLGVEEQFYIFLPLLLVGARKRLRPTAVRVAVSAIALVSFGCCVRGLEHDPHAVFFLLPYRAWELLVGSALALGVVPSFNRTWVREAAGVLGLLGVVGSVALLSKAAPFPGWRALPTVLGTALLILAGRDRGASVARLLGWRPLAGIGLISYSLYLWHWPLLVFARQFAPTALQALDIAAIGVASVAMGWISWRWVEQPFRRFGSGSAPTVAVLLAGACAVSATAGVGALGLVSKGWPQRFSSRAQQFTAMQAKEQYFGLYDRGHCFLDYDQEAGDYDSAACFGFSSSQQTRVLIYGDSFAAHLYPGLKAVPGFEVRQYTATSCRPMRTGKRRCDRIHKRFLSKLLRHSKADVVVISGYWQPYYKRFGEEGFSRRLRQTLDAIKKTGKRVILVGQVPTFFKPVPSLLAQHAELQGVPLVRLEANRFSEVNDALAVLARQVGVEFMNPTEVACDDAGCLAAADDQPFNWDFGHLTLAGSKFYAEQLKGMLRELNDN